MLLVGNVWAAVSRICNTVVNLRVSTGVIQPGETKGPVQPQPLWIPAFAGMTVMRAFLLHGGTIHNWRCTTRRTASTNVSTSSSVVRIDSAPAHFSWSRMPSFSRPVNTADDMAESPWVFDR